MVHVEPAMQARECINHARDGEFDGAATANKSNASSTKTDQHFSKSMTKTRSLTFSSVN